MHIHKRVWGNLVAAAAIVTLVLPLATVPLASTASAQTSNTTSVITGVGAATPPVAFNPIGTSHTATFTCLSAGAPTGDALTGPGCYDMTATATDNVTGASTTVLSGTCGTAGATITGSGTAQCFGTPALAQAVCPAATDVTPAFTFNTATGFCEAPLSATFTATACTTGTPAHTTAGVAYPAVPPGTVNAAGTTCQIAPTTAQMTATINPGANDFYTISFSGYFGITGAAGTACPAGSTTPTSVGAIPTLTGGPGTTAAPAGTSWCGFTVTVEKKYFEVTAVTLTPSSNCTGGILTFAEGLKAFFGPICTVTAAVTGTTVLKTGVDCATEPATGTLVPSSLGFPTGATYQCANGVLSVTGITPTTAVPITINVSGPGSAVCTSSISGLAAGGAGGTAFATTTGVGVNVCPTGPGSVSITACLGTAAAPLPNNQPAICSKAVTITFTVQAARVVPYVRWAGEKIVLTKCFGIGLAGATVEFTLDSNSDTLSGTLLPINTTTEFTTTNTTVFTTADAHGCASVIGYADGEGVMNVDAAVFAPTTVPPTSTGTVSPTEVGSLINEHAFQVFYLKFESVSLENINMATYTVAQAIAPYLSFLAASAPNPTAGPANASAPFDSPLHDATASELTPTSFTLPGAPGTGGTGTESVPLCAPQYVRAMVHGYFEYPGDPSGRPASTVAIPGAASNSAGSYVLPAGRWVLPEDWPLLATFAGFGAGTNPASFTPSSVLAWDLNSGYAFNPASERPVICGNGGLSTTPGPVLIQPATIEAGNPAITDYLGALGAPTSTGVGTTADLPCFGEDGNGTIYSTAPDGICAAGTTIAPFDATEACTNPFPLTYAPSGSAVVSTPATPVPATTTTPAAFTIGPAGPNSSYLPNGTLNEWDAPMPPAMVSFGITSGPGTFAEVNKTGLYEIHFTTPLPSSGTCPTPYIENTTLATPDCEIEIYPDPFYTEAIPASPLIPPTTNNGGYLWNSWNFTFGTVTTVTTTAPFAAAGAPAGGFVPGQSTGTPTPTGRGGLSSTALSTGACPNASATESVTVANGSGFLPGQTVEVYNPTAGTLVITPTPSPLVLSTTYTPNSNTLVFTCASVYAALGAHGLTVVPAGMVYMSTDFGLPLTGTSGLTPNTTVTVYGQGGKAFTSYVTEVDTTNNIVYIANGDGLAAALVAAGTTCAAISLPYVAGVYTPTSTACEPATLVPPGSTIVAGPPAGATGGAFGTPPQAAPPKPYPFWQWIAGQSSTTPTNATVYSDNHGEAVVALQTGVAIQVAPTSGACPSGYTPLSAPGGAVVNCLLPYSALGPLGFANITAATSQFSASKPGCLNTFPTGTTSVATSATIGAHGPAAGQICVNALGGLEFGAGATLGATTISAVADYPYVRDHPQVGSAPLTKVFTSAFMKDITVSAGTPGPAGTTAYTVTVTALDICGAPLVGEPVSVYALGNAGAAVLAPVSYGTLISAASNSATVTVNTASGQATFSLEVLNTAISTAGLVVKAVFPIEMIERFATVIPGTTTPTTATVVYAPGWQMIGGPSGSNFSVAEALFSWDPVAQAYTNATAAAGNISSAPPACTGYWAYFAAAMTITLPATSHPGDTATCTLKTGWNLVGNPFGSAATIQSGVTAFHWNGTSYDTVGVIPVGGSVWIYNSGTLPTVTLTAT